jgi:hypothetical protein
VALAAALAGACTRFSDAQAEALVRKYLAALIEAYRASDEEVVDPLVGEVEGNRLVGLIGVKRDIGLFLDAKLTDVQFERFDRDGERLSVVTREQWYYRDRRIGSGEQVGDDSTDSYRLRYHVAQYKGRWVIAQVEFVDPPVVGRKLPPLKLDARAAHGLLAADAGESN